MSITAVVTGAASGVGRECTRILLARGYHIAAMDLRADAARRGAVVKPKSGKRRTKTKR